MTEDTIDTTSAAVALKPILKKRTIPRVPVLTGRGR